MQRVKLPKEIYFPMVEGSQYARAILGDKAISGFVTYLRGKVSNTWVKIVSHHQERNYFFNLPLALKQGYHIKAVEKDLVEKSNKYLRRQYTRMARLLNNGDKERYSKLYMLLMRKSDLFILVMIVRKLRFYAESYSPEKAIWLMRKVRRMLMREDTNLKIRRAFLPQYDSDGWLIKHRPLGVPSIEWRVIGGMMELYLSNLWNKEWAFNQYACMPNKGVADAWIAILTWVEQRHNIIGYDLAKFFDAVYLKAVSYGMWDLNKGLRIWYEKVNERKAQIRGQDRELERERQSNLLRERPIIHYPPVEDFMTAATEEFWNPADQGLPQGLNTSPLLACRVLQETGALDSWEIVQYMDDGIIMTDENPHEKLQEFKENLKTVYTGISLSASKTELIKKDNQWIKPLKFLGCEYDGKTFRANTRTKGVFEVMEAPRRIQEIIKWLKENGKDIVNVRSTRTPRKELSKLISSSWLREDELALRPIHPKVDWSLWDPGKLLITTAKATSIEAKVVEKYIKGWNPVIWSTNTMSMMSAGYLLSCARRSKATIFKEQSINKGRARLASRNRLELDW